MGTFLPSRVPSGDMVGHWPSVAFLLTKYQMELMGIRIRMFLSLQDPDPLVRGKDPGVRNRIRLRILPFSHKCVEQTEIMFAKYGEILTKPAGKLWGKKYEKK